MRKQTKLEKNQAADQRYTQNLAFFRVNSEELYQTFVNYQPQDLTLAFDEDENVSIINRKTGRFVYPENPASYAQKQVDQFLKSDNASIVKFFDPNVVKTEDYHHNDMMDRYMALYGDKLRPICHPKSDQVIQQLIMIGIGTGLHIEELLRKQKVRNLVVMDSNLDALYLSLYFVDWSKLFREVTNIEIIIEDDEEGFFERLHVYFSNMGTFLLGKYYVYHHYQNPLLERVVDNFTFKLASSNAFVGFYDDERVGLAHTVKNIESNLPFARKMLDMKKDLPVFVVGNGPSLDHSIDFLKANQDKIIIISCGSTIGTLQKIGLKPDIHVEQAQQSSDTVFGVKGGQHFVSGQGGLNGNLGRKRIPDLTDDDHVRVLAEDMTQRFFERQMNAGIDRTLGYPVYHILHRLCGRDDARLRIIDMVDAAIDRRGLAGTGGPGNHSNPTGQIQSVVFKSLEHAGGHSDFLEMNQNALTV